MNPFQSVVAVFAVIVFMLGSAGCASDGLDADYVFTYVKSGPRSGQGRNGTDEEKAKRKEMFDGHMANIDRLAKEGSVILAGPFERPTDPTWRGVLVMDVARESRAAELAASDPAVRAQEFIAEPHAMLGPSSLRRAVALDNAMQEELRKSPPGPGEPQSTMRVFTMVTTDDYYKTRSSIARSEWRDKILWSGRFKGTARGLFVLDAKLPGEVRGGLRNPGDIAVDGWWSTAALTRLRDESAAK